MIKNKLFVAFVEYRSAIVQQLLKWLDNE